MEEHQKLIQDLLSSLYEKYKNESWILSGNDVCDKIENSKPGLFKSGTVWYNFYKHDDKYKYDPKNIQFGLDGGVIFEKNVFWNSHGMTLPKSTTLGGPGYFKFYEKNIGGREKIHFKNQELKEDISITNECKIQYYNSTESSYSSLELTKPEVDFIVEFLNEFDLKVKDYKNEKKQRELLEKVENITYFNFSRKDGNKEVEISFTLISEEGENLVLTEWENTTGKRPIKEFTFKIKERGSYLDLIDDKGSYNKGFFKEDRIRIEKFLDNVNYLQKNKLSIQEFIDEIKVNKKEEKKLVEKKISSLLIEEFDKDNNGELDILEGDNLLMDLLEKNQSEITEFDHSLVQNIIRLNKFLNTKKKNLINVFKLLKTVDRNKDLEKVLSILRQGIDNYQSLLIHSLNMVISLKEKQMITYYELYETFDTLGVFNSKWENEISGRLSNIDSKLSDVVNSIKEVMLSIQSMEDSITSSLDELTYSTKSSFEQLNSSLTSELQSIRGGIEWNNLLTGINAYQTYKLRKGE